jgi:DNA primase
MGQSGVQTQTRGEVARAQTGARRGFALLSPQFLDELRGRVMLSNLIGRTVPLKKAGNEYKACCPFHQEKTPSFWVNDQKGFYHCFGCSAHGDAIRWLTDARGMVFMDAVKQLAEETGLELPKPAPEEIARQERALGQHELMEAAVRYFQMSLTRQEGAGARNYLALRDVGDTAISEFGIGYAPEGRSNLKRALEGFSEEQLIEAGLLISVDEKEPYDRFRNRIMVPIRNPRGKTIAFGGRILGEGEPKYLNSPDTFLFDKSRVLFNLDRAAPASRQANRIIVVEGYFDVIGLDQGGIREAVAPMGTALTEHQIELLWRLVDEPVLCFDGDSAGRKAAERACHRAMPGLRPGKQLRVALLPAGKDPDDIVRERGRKGFEQVVEAALPLASYLYRSELDKIDSSRPEQRANLRKNLEEVARSCSDRFVADEFARSFTKLFFEDFGWKGKQRQDIFRSAVRTSPRVSPDLARLFIRSTLYGLTRFPQVAAAHADQLGDIPVAHPDLRRWRDAIGEAVMSQPHLQEDGVRAILDAELLPQTLQRDIRSDLRFGFTRKATPSDRAVRQLETMVMFLAEEANVVGELGELDRQAVADAGGDGYVAIEARRQHLRETRMALFDRGSNWDGELQ